MIQILPQLKTSLEILSYILRYRATNSSGRRTAFIVLQTKEEFITQLNEDAKALIETSDRRANTIGVDLLEQPTIDMVACLEAARTFYVPSIMHLRALAMTLALGTRSNSTNETEIGDIVLIQVLSAHVAAERLANAREVEATVAQLVSMVSTLDYGDHTTNELHSQMKDQADKRKLCFWEPPLMNGADWVDDVNLPLFADTKVDTTSNSGVTLRRILERWGLEILVREDLM
jgi:hypothetical protein